METENCICPACGREFPALKNMLLHFQQAINGLGTSPDAHERWAQQRGITRLSVTLGDRSALAKLKAALMESWQH